MQVYQALLYVTLDKGCFSLDIYFFSPQNLKNRIRQEYKYQKDDLKYMDQKKRFEYLHKKLGHIKRLILDYDTSHPTVS